jgi:hypothetical protein
MALLTARGEASPNQMAAELGVPVGTLSYHTRLLRDLGWIELVRTAPRRGAVEHFYRAVSPPVVEDEEWARLPLSIRRRLSGMTVGQILRSAAAAAAAGGFDGPSAFVVRQWLELDEQGWRELSEACTRVLDEASRIQERSNERRRQDAGAEIEGSELAILHFTGRSGSF